MGDTKHSTLADALAAAQAELTDPKKDKTAKAGAYSYAYTDIAGVLEVVRPVLSRHGIAIVQGVESNDRGDLVLRTTLLHGEEVMTSALAWPMPQDIQKLGSAITYLRRYSLCAMVGVAADDDDGASAREEPARRSQAPRKTSGNAKPAPKQSKPPEGDTASDHHPSWEKDRARFCAALNELGTSYDVAKAESIAAGWGKPSTWPQSDRDSFLADVKAGRVNVEPF